VIESLVVGFSGIVKTVSLTATNEAAFKMEKHAANISNKMHRAFSILEPPSQIFIEYIKYIAKMIIKQVFVLNNVF